MEKLVKQRNNKILLAFLPKAASSFTFQVSPPLSPVGGAAGKGLSGPNLHVSLIPKGAPRKSKNGSFDAREPTSPKVSCIGQIKSNKKKTVAKSKLASPPPQPPPQASPKQVKVRNRKHLLMMLKVSKGKKHDNHKPEVSNPKSSEVAETVIPSLGQMKQLSSARGGALSDFDWRACNITAGGAAGCISNPLYEGKGVKSGKE